jgi:hypothetical protein
VFQEYPFFSFGPVDVIFQDFHLGFLAIGYRSKVIEQGPDWHPFSIYPSHRTEWNGGLLSLAVLAFAVEDMKALDMVMTSAKPFASLSKCVRNTAK